MLFVNVNVINPIMVYTFVQGRYFIALKIKRILKFLKNPHHGYGHLLVLSAASPAIPTLGCLALFVLILLTTIM